MADVVAECCESIPVIVSIASFPTTTVEGPIVDTALIWKGIISLLSYLWLVTTMYKDCILKMH